MSYKLALVLLFVFQFWAERHYGKSSCEKCIFEVLVKLNAYVKYAPKECQYKLNFRIHRVPLVHCILTVSS